MRNFRMRTKLVLSVGVLSLGYIFFLLLVLWTSTVLRRHLRMAADALFPAALAGQQAEAGFQKLTADYKDAVVLQDTAKLTVADSDAGKISDSLKIVSRKASGNAELVGEASRLQARFDTFSMKSKDTYARMIGAAGAIDPEIMENIKSLAADNTQIAAGLHEMNGKIGQRYFAAELEAALGATDRQRWFTYVLFGVLVSFGVWVSRVLEREISVPLRRSVEALERVAQGDLTVSLQVGGKDEVGKMGEALNVAMQRLRGSLQEVAASAAQSSVASRELSVASGAIASGAREQASSLERTAASMEEITATMRQTADNAQQARLLASGGDDGETPEPEGEFGDAEAGAGRMNALAAMAEINAAATKIASIITAVDEIAFKTNLLSVNAAIEAARAGDQGRGFAVVATEVRGLARHSADAAKEIKALIEDSLTKVETGTELVSRVTQLVSEIANASKEQSGGAEQVNTAVTQLDKLTQANTAQTEELSATALTLSEQAHSLLEMVSQFQLGDPSDGTPPDGTPPDGGSTGNRAGASAVPPRRTPVHLRVTTRTAPPRGGTPVDEVEPDESCLEEV